jgi:hypothetical protein
MGIADSVPDRSPARAVSRPGVNTSSAAASAAPVAFAEEFAAIIRRAERLGIPAWRVMTALGAPLPVGGAGDA